jgi:hypothetical protein
MTSTDNHLPSCQIDHIHPVTFSPKQSSHATLQEPAINTIHREKTIAKDTYLSGRILWVSLWMILEQSVSILPYPN